MQIKKRNEFSSTQKLVLGALLSALVVVLQLAGSFVRFGIFQVSLVLIPIVIGAAVCGVPVATWLGFVFGLVVLLNGDATLFLAVNAPGTILTVLVKGMACGFVAGVVYRLLAHVNRYLAVVCAAIACPVVNSGVFLIGCRLFFWETIISWGEAAGFASAVGYMFLGLVGGNFLFELGTNMLLSPAVVRLLALWRKDKA